jgi:hypothetical protein
MLSWALGLPGILLRVQAFQLSNVSDALSTTKPGIGSNHTVRLTTPTGVLDDGSTIDITLPDGFDMSSITEDDVDIADDGSDLTTDAVCGAVQAAVTTSGQHLIIEICNAGGGAIAAASVISIEIGLHATASGAGSHQIINHANVGDYGLTIDGTMEDSGFTRIVIVDSVNVSGAVETYFYFQISGVNADQVVNADPVHTFATTTATTVPFGMVNVDTEYLLAQDLSVTTNSENGFTVAVYADTDLISTSGATIDSFTDGTAVSLPTTWNNPSAQYGSPDTYGHWGLTTEDVSLTDNDSFGDALYVGNFINTPREVMYATSSADGSTPNIGSTRVGYKMEVTTMQEASTDYSTRLVYIATPTF